MLRRNAVFVAATSQHVGKTSACLGLVAGLKHFMETVGYMKPIGQKSIQVTMGGNGLCEVDKDVPLFKELLGCTGSYREMSPVLIGKGYTRRFLDGKIDKDKEFAKIEASFDSISANNDFTVVEGTGHIGVGSSVGLSNARVASRLGLPMVIVLNGGIGSSLDQFMLNVELCKSEGVSVCGVIMNKVRPDKLQDIRGYTETALEKWFNVPLLACIPDQEFLSRPALLDFEKLGMDLIAGTQFRGTHFDKLETVLTDATKFQAMLERLDRRTLYIIHSSRADLLTTYSNYITQHNTSPPQTGLIIVEASAHPELLDTLAMLHKEQIPILISDETLETVSQKIKNHPAKLNIADIARTNAVMQHYSSHIDFDAFFHNLDQLQNFNQKIKSVNN